MDQESSVKITLRTIQQTRVIDDAALSTLDELLAQEQSIAHASRTRRQSKLLYVCLTLSDGRESACSRGVQLKWIRPCIAGHSLELI